MPEVTENGVLVVYVATRLGDEVDVLVYLTRLLVSDLGVAYHVSHGA